MSSRVGKPATETRAPVVSAISLNECPVPRARTRADFETSCCSSAIEDGRCSCSARNRTFRAQLVSGTVVIGGSSGVGGYRGGSVGGANQRDPTRTEPESTTGLDKVTGQQVDAAGRPRPDRGRNS